ncbi:hypothetical protein EAH68_11220 [Corynebacterium hylobatis]|uniref:DNA-directed RNA polymerase II n=1 Tax=Corynebacterium hylobatis TaxID=1859290 RepID=A0A3R9ZHZ0_9CORY|nr:hypothetical protein [Corynebacterium hylobatis]RSZ61831.1 hypothetical protein EAH68_11220 [Corynebacterium hylobatis]
MEGTKGQVNTEKRRVYLFIAVGLLAAAAVGYGVWRASTPSTPSASDIATVTAEVSTNSDTAGQIAPTPDPGESRISTANTAPAPAAAPADDPYLAPNAVVQAAPTDIGPTVIYRPENIMDTPTTPEPAAAQPTPSPAPTGAVTVSGRPENTGPTTTPPGPEQTQTTTTPPTPDTGTPTPVEPATPEPAAPATAPTQAPTTPATTTPQPAPAGSSLPD